MHRKMVCSSPLEKMRMNALMYQQMPLPNASISIDECTKWRRRNTGEQSYAETNDAW